MVKLMAIMLKMNCRKWLRVIGLPYKCKANKVRILISGSLISIIAVILLHIYINEPIWAKENLLLAINTNLHLIFMFTSLIGMVISINWIRFEEYSEVIFMLSLPLQPNQIYTYKTCSLLVECLILVSFILTPFVMDMESLIKISVIILVIVSGLMLGIGLGAKMLQRTNCNIKSLYSIIVTTIIIFLIALKETRYVFVYQNSKVLFLVNCFIIWFSSRLIIKNFVALLTLTSGKEKQKNVITIAKYNYEARNEIVAFIYKDFTSFVRNKRDLLKTIVMIGIIIIMANINGINLDIPFAYIFPYILCNIWIIDLAGQETYYYQINKLIYNGIARNYYIKRLLSSTLIVLPLCIINGVLFALISNNQSISQNISYTLCLSVLEIFLATGVSILFKRESPSCYSPAFGVSIIGQITYYIIGIVYVFVFELTFTDGEIFAALFLGGAIACNIVINAICIMRE